MTKHCSWAADEQAFVGSALHHREWCPGESLRGVCRGNRSVVTAVHVRVSVCVPGAPAGLMQVGAAADPSVTLTRRRRAGR